MPEVVLGLNAYHGDAAAAVLVDGVCLAAAEEERFTRVKHQAGFPSRAVRWCLDSLDLNTHDIDHIAIGRNPSAKIFDRIKWVLRHPDPAILRSRLSNTVRILDVATAVSEAANGDTDSLRARQHRIEHHRAHLASAFLCSPFEEAACLSMDGMGDFSSTMWGKGEGREIKVTGSVGHPHSLGHYYTAFTQFLGLPNYGDEYKLMGLAAYGRPRFLNQLNKVLTLREGMYFALGLDYFVHHKKGVPMLWEGAPSFGPLFSPKMQEVFGPAREPQSEVTERDVDLAASVQAKLEETTLEMLRRLQKRFRSPNLVLAGGVALNCLMTGKILSETPFEQIWIQPASNDSGTAIGSALWTWHMHLQRDRDWTMSHVYFGPSFGEADYKRAFEDSQLSYRWLHDDELIPYVAERIASGAITGWFQGEMEFGPRALGNRSIVCDPRRQDMKDILNARIKHREPFRPFAPSVLEENSEDWFEQDYPSPYMLMAYKVRSEKRSLIPAVTHEDGTARLQTVARATNSRFHSLLSAFHRITSVPVLLNTSFNENEPICCTPQEAVDCFVRTNMDLLVLGNFISEKQSAEDN